MKGQYISQDVSVSTTLKYEGKKRTSDQQIE